MENITQVYGLPCVVAINRFVNDTDAELALIADKCRALGVNVALSEVWGRGGEGGVALAEEVLQLCGQPHDFRFAYELDRPLRDKIEAIVRCYCEWADRDWSLFAYHLLTQHLFLAMVPDGTPNPVDVVREVIVNAMASGEIPSRDPDLAAASAIGTVMQPATYKVYGRFEGPLSDHVAFFADAAWAVLAVPPR